MPVKKHPDGQRSVEAEAEVPGTPEQVWQAIASGPGITSWFVPSEIDGRVGGTAISHFGPGNSMDSVAKITEWTPPHRFVAESNDGGPGKVATEWIVEARGGSTCTVRVVHRWFAETDDWDGQFEGHTHGWAAFFRVLRLYLTHFPGQPSAAVQLGSFAPGSVTEAWDKLIAALGFGALAQDAEVATVGSAPPLAGRVAHTSLPAHPEVLLRLAQPTSGAAHLFAMAMGGQTYLSLRFYFYGPRAADAAAQAELAWQAWMAQQFRSEA